MTKITSLHLQGFYTYNDSELSSVDDGFMEFQLSHDPETSTIRGSGSDSTGDFTIIGFLDDNDLRFLKSYPTHSWKYTGTIIQSHIDGSSSFAGGWGNAEKQYGRFVLVTAPGGQPKASLDGNWSGHYYYGGQPGVTEPPMNMAFSIHKPHELTGKGSDKWGSFTLTGSVDGKEVRFLKNYEQHSWVYQGTLAQDEKHIRGEWGDGTRAYGTFTFSKGHAISIQQANEMMPPKQSLSGSMEKAMNEGAVEELGAQIVQILTSGFGSIISS